MGTAPVPCCSLAAVRVQPGIQGPAEILLLQQTIGNRAVMRLLDKQLSVVQAKLVDDPEEESVQLRAEGQREPSNTGDSLGRRERREHASDDSSPSGQDSG